MGVPVLEFLAGTAENLYPARMQMALSLPGEVITKEVVDYVRSGLDAGMELPDPADSELNTFRVVVRKP